MENLPLSGSLIKKQLIEGWNRGNMIMDEYKEMFVNQYLLSLRERYRNSPKQARVRSHESPKVGDIVQIKDQVKNREGWKVGRISELIKGIDGLCRVAKVKVRDSVFTRSIAHLYPLEVDEDVSFQDSTIESSTNEDNGINAEQLSKVLPLRTEESNAHVPTNTSSSNEGRHDLDKTMENDLTMDNGELLENPDLTQIRETAPEQVPETDNEGTPNLQSEVRDQRRTAAVQALERIHRWTQELLSNIN